MKKILFVMIIILLLNLSLVNAITQQEINEAKNLIDSKADCKSLSDSQLEIIGEYYMEQMMPGISHERAHQMMGLAEGSEAEEQFHINLAKRSYCGENVGTGGMMGGGMIGNYYQTPQNNNSYQNNFFGFQIFFYIILTLIVIVIILIIILLINKSSDNTKQKRRKTK